LLQQLARYALLDLGIRLQICTKSDESFANQILTQIKAHVEKSDNNNGFCTRKVGQLFIQLYENAIAVKDTNNPDLVQKITIGNKTVYKILNEQPTLSLNGNCAGPLYIFDVGNNKFIYVLLAMALNPLPLAKKLSKK